MVVVGWLAGVAAVILAGIVAPRSGGGAVMVLGAAASAVLIAAEVRATRVDPDRSDAVGAARRAVVLILAATIPVAFDPRTYDVFNVVKFTILASGAVLLAALGAVDLLRGRTTAARSVIGAVAGGIAAWAAVAAIFGSNPAVSFLGFYKSYDGVVTAAASVVVFLTVLDVFAPRGAYGMLRVLFFAGGGLTSLYGALQLHDHLTDSGARWDWVKWGEATFKHASIWATFGNPNHLAGFLAVMLPTGAVVALLARRRGELIGAVVIMAVAVVEIVQTTARGAWVAAVVSLLVLAILLLPDLRTRVPVAAAIGGGLVAALGAAVLLLGSSVPILSRIASITDIGGASSGGQRLQLWQAAIGMFVDNPLTGVGTDSYRLAFTEYQNARFVETFGPTQLANGAHNVFFNLVATQGLPGLALFVAFLVLVGREVWRGWFALRDREAAGETATDAGTWSARSQRIVLSGAVAATVAYLVQASFNVQQIGLTFIFFLLAGAAIVASGGPTTAADAGPHRRWSELGGLRFATIPIAAVAGVLVYAGMKPYLADFHQLTARRLEAQGQEAAVDVYLQAAETYEWEPVVYDGAADVERTLAQRLLQGQSRGTRDQVTGRLRSSVRYYEQARALLPDDGQLAYKHGATLLLLSRLEESDERRAEAIDALRHATARNPWHEGYAGQLAAALNEDGDKDGARRVLRDALARIPASQAGNVKQQLVELGD